MVNSLISYQVLFYVYMSQTFNLLFPSTNRWPTPPSPKPVLLLTIITPLLAVSSFTCLMYVYGLFAQYWLVTAFLLMLMQSYWDVAYVSGGVYVLMPWKRVTWWLMLFSVFIVGSYCCCNMCLFSLLPIIRLCFGGDYPPPLPKKMCSRRWSDNKCTHMYMQPHSQCVLYKYFYTQCRLH